MSHYVGLDVSVKSVSICVVDAQGTVLARGETASDPDRITPSSTSMHLILSAWCMKAEFLPSG